MAGMKKRKAQMPQGMSNLNESCEKQKRPVWGVQIKIHWILHPYGFRMTRLELSIYLTTSHCLPTTYYDLL